MANAITRREKAVLALRILSRMDEDPLKHWGAFFVSKKPRRRQHEPELEHRHRLCALVKDACANYLARCLIPNDASALDIDEV